MPLPNNPLGGDEYNTQGFLATIRLPQTSNSYVGRIDHDFSDKWHWYGTYRDVRFVNLTNNQVDIGGVLPGRHVWSSNRGCSAAAAAVFLGHRTHHQHHSDHHQYAGLQLHAPVLAVRQRKRSAAASGTWRARWKSAAKRCSTR